MICCDDFQTGLEDRVEEDLAFVCIDLGTMNSSFVEPNSVTLASIPSRRRSESNLAMRVIVFAL